ncbi:MAG: tRNA (adenosine(37)-N6)-threonylcarbamoyltransferase complex ATPase subunit type 1 TsaE [Deltaproteobacteria bacterium]|nr:tRNA (adenosine(37)-N6)-threonylcarbamoyltransferase complex ATPase subunit type 1 TsaE [Deltaproteobacteria bacterium]
MTKSILINSHSEDDTIAIGQALGTLFNPGDIISMLGDLGTGKTRLAKGVISKALKIPVDEINSPSFTIVNRYEGPFTIDHADLYRVGPEAIEELGLMEVLDSNGALLIEWASEKSPILTSELRITFYKEENENSRILKFEYLGCGDWSSRFQEFIDYSSAQTGFCLA